MSGGKCSHGIGGAGNFRVADVDQKYFTTGIGGAGNMRRYNAVEARIAQDIPQGTDHVPQATAAGIGGYGNLRAMHKRRQLAGSSASTSNRSSLDSQASATSSAPSTASASSIREMGLANWTRAVIFGR